MTKIKTLRRILLPCCTATPSPATVPTTQYRLSTSLRDDIPSETSATTTTNTNHSHANNSLTPDDDSVTGRVSHVPPRPSKSMVICTFFGARRSHVYFCVQHDRLSTKPSLLLELSLSTHSLVKEMHSGLLRLALESNDNSTPPSNGGKGKGTPYCPLHAVSRWTVYCNGKRVGSAARRKASEDIKMVLKKMENMTVGAGVIPSVSPNSGGEVMYMRANYEWVVGGADSESFHLVSPDDCPGQELSVFLLRSR